MTDLSASPSRPSEGGSAASVVQSLPRIGRQFRDDEQTEITEATRSCEEEAIRIPGEVQPHGCLVACDWATQRITRVSQSCREHLGLDPDRMLGRPIGEVLPGLDPAADRQDRLPARKAQTIRFDNGGEFEFVGRNVGSEWVVELMPRPSRLATSQSAVSEFLVALAGEWDLDDLTAAAVDEIQSLTGYDRVMVYQFDADFNGAVVAEAVADGLEPYLGLNYPASDIPAQARALYLEQRVRVLVDVDYEGSGLSETASDRPPLDLSSCHLRSLSPVHRRYLKNMGVAATLVMSIVVRGELWGMVACHHRTPRLIAFSQLSDLVGVADLLSLQIARAEETRHSRRLEQGLQLHREIIEDIHADPDLVGGLYRHRESLMTLVGADGIAFWFGDHVVTAGETPSRGEIVQITEKLDQRDMTDPLATSNMSQTLGLEGEIGTDSAGLIALAFWPSDYVLFFRQSRSYSVKWAGEPIKAVQKDGDGRLQPRSSFDAWVETVENEAAPWSSTDQRAASEFRNSLATHIIRRSRDLKELHDQLSRKTAEVEQFVYSVSHDLKSPLVTCHGFLGLMREDLEAGRLNDVRDSLDRVERAAGVMNTFIEDLLLFSRIGRDENSVRETVDLNGVVTQVIDSHEYEIRDLQVTVEIACDLPVVEGFRNDLLRVFDNLVTNALKYAMDGDKRRVAIGCRTATTEHTITVRDFGTGIEASYHEKALRLFQRVQAKKTGSGVGLATVVKIVELHGGRVWLENPDGGGLQVCLSLPRITGSESPDRSAQASRSDPLDGA